MKSVVVVIICSGLCVCWAALILFGGSLLVDGPSSQCHPQRRGNTWSGRWEHLQSYPAAEIPASSRLLYACKWSLYSAEGQFWRLRDRLVTLI